MSLINVSKYESSSIKNVNKAVITEQVDTGNLSRIESSNNVVFKKEEDTIPKI
jgi:hypothetical protein